MDRLSEYTAHCPFCGARLTLFIDTSSGTDHAYTEDCHVCCQPMLVHLSFSDGGQWYIHLEPE